MSYHGLDRMRPRLVHFSDFLADLQRLGIELKKYNPDFIWFKSEEDLNLYRVAGKYTEKELFKHFSIW